MQPHHSQLSLCFPLELLVRRLSYRDSYGEDRSTMERARPLYYLLWRRCRCRNRRTGRQEAEKIQNLLRPPTFLKGFKNFIHVERGRLLPRRIVFKCHQELAHVILRRNQQVPDVLKLYCARHTFGTVAMAETRNPGLVKEVMGHESLSTTMIYLHPERPRSRMCSIAAINRRTWDFPQPQKQPQCPRSDGRQAQVIEKLVSAEGIEPSTY